MEGRFSCADCYVKACRTRSEEKYPAFCPTKNMDPALLESAMAEYADKEKGGLVLEGSDLPTIDGVEVDLEDVFEIANSVNGITYPGEPTLDGDVGSQTITFGGVTVYVPSYYTATLEGNTVSLELNGNAIPEIGATAASGDDPAIPAMVVTDEMFALGLTSTNPNLWYGLATSDTPNGEYANPDPSTLVQGTGAAMALAAARGEGETGKYYKIYVTDIAP